MVQNQFWLSNLYALLLFVEYYREIAAPIVEMLLLIDHPNGIITRSDISTSPTLCADNLRHQPLPICSISVLRR
jgi:hypothetical protein